MRQSDQNMCNQLQALENERGYVTNQTNSPRFNNYINMPPRLSGHFSISGLVFFVLKFLLGIAGLWSRETFAILTLKPRSHVRILIYRTWAILTGPKAGTHAHHPHCCSLHSLLLCCSQAIAFASSYAKAKLNFSLSILNRKRH